MKPAFTESEAVEDRANELLAAGDVTVVSVDGFALTATVRGSSGCYVVTRDPGTYRFHCTCPNCFTCSHVVATAKIVQVAVPRVRTKGPANRV